MSIEFDLSKSKILKLYNKAIDGDLDSIMKLADYYNEKNRFRKALEWYVYGAQKGFTACMSNVSLQIMSSHLYYPEASREEVVVLGLYWAEKFKENCSSDLDEYASNLVTHMQKILATYRYRAVFCSIDFETVNAPDI